MKKEFPLSVLILKIIFVGHISCGLSLFTKAPTLISTENTITRIETRTDRHDILEVIFSLLIFLDDTRKNRRGHIWDTEFVSSGMRRTKTNATTSKTLPAENDFFQKFYEFFISSDANKHVRRSRLEN